MSQRVGGVRLRGLSIALLTAGAIGWAGAAWAQNITLDGTLGRSATLTGPRYVIQQEDGRAVGSNLFHSLGRFNLNRGERVNFQSDASIRNILTRVTGGTRSTIDGLIFTSSFNVNLFLINPSGILFGPNARLDIGSSSRGSFVATTTDALVWPDGSRFSATNPNSGDSLLRIVGDPSGFLATQRNLRPIEVRGNTTRRSILAVYPGQSLILLGGDILIDKGILGVYSPEGGQIEVGGVVGAGTVGLTVAGNELQLGLPESVDRADVAITNGSTLDVRAASGGNLVVYARNLDISQSYLLAGIGSGQGNSTSQAGNIRINATDSVRITQSSEISNDVQPNATGRGGNIQVTTGSLIVTDGSELNARTFGLGNSGNIIINAHDQVLVEKSRINNSVESTARGNSGNIQINTRSLKVDGLKSPRLSKQGLGAGALISNDTYGLGNGGDIIINAQDQVVLDRGGSIVTQSINTGNAGNIRISTGSLIGTNIALVQSITRGRGNAGNITVNARDRIFFSGGSKDNISSGIKNDSISRFGGNGGKITITTGSLILENFASLQAGAFSQGNAGSILISVHNGVRLANSSSIFSAIYENAVGNGGNINITAGSLTLTGGSQIDASTFGRGNAGNINLAIRDILTIDGINPVLTDRSSTLFSEVSTGAVGNGGNIYISTGSLFVTNGGQIDTKTRGFGNSGSIFINARDRVVFDGFSPYGKSTRALSSVDNGAQGRGGNITISTRNLTVSNGAQLLTNTMGQGDGGSIIINARENVVFSGYQSFRSQIFPSAAFSRVNSDGIGNAGNIEITASTLYLANRAGLFSETLGQGKAGNVVVNASDAVILTDRGTIDGSTSSPFTGGSIAISTNDLLMRNGTITVDSQGTGDTGNITINSRTMQLSDRARIVAEANSQNGGDITLNNSDLLLLRRGSQISTTAGTQQAGGNGGNITINSPNGFIVGVLRENSDITANAFTGNGGNVNITAQGIYGLQFQPRLTPNSDITASSEFGFSGTVTLNIPDTDPSRGFISLPNDLSDPTTLIDTRCQPGSRGYASSYIETGRSGIPASPDDLFTADPALPNWVMPPSTPSPSHSITPPPHHSPTPDPLTDEANTLLRTPDGSLHLVRARSLSPVDFWRSPDCAFGRRGG